MQKKILFISLVLVMTSTLLLKGQSTKQDSSYKKYYIGCTLYLSGNFIPNDKDRPEYVQLNVGYRITPKDVVCFELKISIYAWPIGIPFEPSFVAPGLNYPGHARILAPTLGYQRFWWKGVYTFVYALNAFEKYMDGNKKRLGMDTRYI